MCNEMNKPISKFKKRIKVEVDTVLTKDLKKGMDMTKYSGFIFINGDAVSINIPEKKLSVTVLLSPMEKAISDFRSLSDNSQ